jgi:hypothetical protein
LTIPAEATRSKAVRAAAAFAQEAMMARERVEALIKDVEAWAALAEREAQERVLKAEAESTASLALVHREAEESARRVALLEGELTDPR